MFGLVFRFVRQIGLLLPVGRTARFRLSFLLVGVLFEVPVKHLFESVHGVAGAHPRPYLVPAFEVREPQAGDLPDCAVVDTLDVPL